MIEIYNALIWNNTTNKKIIENKTIILENSPGL